MLPARRKKVDLSTMTEEEKRLYRLTGKLPGHQLPTYKKVLSKVQRDRKWLDSGDYALSKAGKVPQNTPIPIPENIPHASPALVPNPSNPQISTQISPVNSPTSPAKESSHSHESTLSDVMSTKLSATEEPAENADPEDDPHQET